MSTTDGGPAVPPGLALAAAVLGVSTSSIMIRYAQTMAPSLVIAAYRVGLASLALAPALAWRGRDELRAMSRSQAGLSLAAGLCLGIHFASWITSLSLTSVASSVVLVSTAPLFVAALSPLGLRERVSPGVLTGMGLSFAGTLLIAMSDACATPAGLICPPWSSFVSGRAFQGDLLALLGAASAGGYMLIGRRVRAGLSLLSYVGLAYPAAAALLWALVFLRGYPLAGYPPEAYVWFGLQALVPQLFSHSAYNWALRYLPATVVSISVLGEPVGSTLLAYALLGERPGWLQWVGGGLVLIGLAVAARPASPRPLASAKAGRRE